MSTPVVLSLFPGIGLLDLAFEEEGFCVVRGPDLLWGGDIHSFRVPPGHFDGIIGGPPCQVHSNASEIIGTSAVDLIPEFVRCVREGDPSFVVMENVTGAANHPGIPREWHPVKLRDWDCGGLTARTRMFWLWPVWFMEPPRRPGEPEHSVMATSWKRGSKSSYTDNKGFLPGDLPVEEYARLQGCHDYGMRLFNHLRDRVLMPERAARTLTVHGLGNGVPLSMGRVIARAVRQELYSSEAA